MAKPEWGSKLTCPKCGTRFYDLGRHPAHCVHCSTEFQSEPVLKSKQPLPESERKPVEPLAKPGLDADLDEDDVKLDDEDEEAIADVSLDDDEADLADIVDDPLADEV